MALREFGSPALKVAVLTLLAVASFAAPVVVAASDVGEPMYEYERAEVVVNDSGIEYDADLGPDVAISDEIACLGARDQRVCQFEKYALRKGGIDVGDDLGPPILRPPRYVQLRGQLYERTYTEIDSGDRVRFGHEPVDAQRVLGLVSVDAERVPPEVAEAAREGEASPRTELDLPEAPIATSDGRYYRIHNTGISSPPATDSWIEWVSFMLPLVGLAITVRLWRRVEISYR